MNTCCRALAVSLLLGTCAASPGPAPSFGLSGVLDVDGVTWTALDDSARVATLTARVDLAEALGATIVRLGPDAPALLSQGALPADFPWLFVDAVVGALSGRDAAVVLPLPELVTSAGRADYREFVARLAERWDGDADFGVPGAKRQNEWPDLDASGSITANEIMADTAARQAWATAHAIGWLEVGDRVRQAEDGGAISETDYGPQLDAAKKAVDGATDTITVLAAGTDMDTESKSRFIDRLDAIDTAGGAQGFTVAGAHLREDIADLSLVNAPQRLESFHDWVRDAGHDAAARWVTEVSFAAGPNDVCSDTRCSERTQAASVAIFTALAVAAGYQAILYRGAIEVSGSTPAAGLLTVDAANALNPTTADLTPRPAYAVWRRLAETLPGTTGSALGALDPNVSAVRFADDADTTVAWLAWFNWTAEVGGSAPYDPSRVKELVLRNVSSDGVTVVTLWPEAVGATIDANGVVATTWTEAVMAVDGGQVTVRLGEDPLLILPSAGPAPVVEEMPDAGGGGDVVEAAADTGGSGGGDEGCHGGGGGVPWGLSALLLAVIWLRRRRRGLSA